MEPRRTIRGAPRQVGKTTLANAIAAESPDCLYLDPENPRDAARLADPGRYLELDSDRLVILDDIQRMPDLFRVLRGQIDERRRSARSDAASARARPPPGRFPQRLGTGPQSRCPR